MGDFVENSEKQSSITIINECKAALEAIDKPFFLYLMTVDESTESIFTVAYKKGDNNVDSLTRLDNKSLEGIEGSIKDHIDEGLREIYNKNQTVNKVAVDFATAMLADTAAQVARKNDQQANPVNYQKGGSRSHKKRRRHKRRHNTKRRNRK
jgi:hypothetical protein